MTDANYNYSGQFRKRFWSKVAVGAPDECWVWMRCRNSKGYGAIRWNGKSLRAHRVTYELACGSIPTEMHVLHRCDIPPCCNPAHLWIGTNADNVRDRDAKGRQGASSGDRNGSRLHPERMPRGDRNGSRLHPERLARGERVKGAKLTEADVTAIRAAPGLLREIAAKYGVTKVTISKILRRKTWAHIP